jgi:drug/metabolite transporter (DMT)-like permease
MTVTAWMLLFGALFQLPLALWQLPDQGWETLSGTSILYVMVSAVFSLYISYTLFYYAVSRIGPSKTGAYANLTPVFTLFFASLIRNEDISAVHIAGLGIILLGIGITKLQPAAKSGDISV